MRPYLGQIKRIERGLLRLLPGHYLYLHCPFREILFIYGIHQVALGKIRVNTLHGHRFIVGKVLYALHGLKVKFHIHHFILIIDQGKGMAAITIHVPMAMGRTTVAHQYHYLVQAFGVEAPEVPHHGRAFTVRTRVSLLGMYKIAEFLRVFDKEYGRVVTHQVPVAIFGIELQREAAWVALGICTTFFAAYGAETYEQLGLLAYLVKYLRLCILADIMRHGECTEGAGTLCVYYPFRYALPVKVGHLLMQYVVLQQQRPSRTCAQRVLILSKGPARCRSQFCGLIISVRHSVSDFIDTKLSKILLTAFGLVELVNRIFL